MAPKQQPVPELIEKTLTVDEAQAAEVRCARVLWILPLILAQKDLFVSLDDLTDHMTNMSAVTAHLTAVSAQLSNLARDGCVAAATLRARIARSHISPALAKDMEVDSDRATSASGTSSRHNSIVYKSQVEVARARSGAGRNGGASPTHAPQLRRAVTAAKRRPARTGRPRRARSSARHRYGACSACVYLDMCGRI